MTKTILITGSTDGIGLETAKQLAGLGHQLLIHGRSDSKLADAEMALSRITGAGAIKTYRADLSDVSDVEMLASAIGEEHPKLDVLINNAGVFKVPNTLTADGFDLRFIVNTVAPYLLTKRLLPRMSGDGRVINLSSAAQAAVSLEAIIGKARLNDNEAYAQSKLALTMWTFHLARSLGDQGPAIIAVNPASFLASKMVKDAYGVQGNDLGVGADILVRAALSDEFAGASGRYYDNDRGQFAPPHPDALDPQKNAALVQTVEAVLAQISG